MTEALESRLPTGTVTFLFSDIEGSTEHVQRLGDRYAGELGEHHRIVLKAVETAGGEIVDRRGEEVFAVFARASAAVAAAIEIQHEHVGRVLRVRIGLHTGEPALSGDGYLGLDVHRAARICAAGHGGQVLVSQTTRALLGAVATRDLGEYDLKGISVPEPIYEVGVPGAARTFPALRAEPSGRKRQPRSQSGPGLKERAWTVRATLATTPAPERPAVDKLVGALFRAARTEGDATTLLARIDRTNIERRLTDCRQMSLTSRRSASEAEKLERQLHLLDTVSTARETLLTTGHREHADSEEIDEATRQLEHLLEQVRTTIGDSAEPLRRTLSRGVYRSRSGEYVVLCYDTAGIQQRRHFTNRSDARQFRDLVRKREKLWRLGLDARTAAEGSDHMAAALATSNANNAAGSDGGVG